MSGRILTVAAFGAALALSTAITASPTRATDEITIGPEARQALNLTIYNGNLALVQDRRQLSVAAGLNRIGFAGVSRAMMSETALLGIEPAARVRLLEQDFAFDLLTPSKIREHAVGQKVQLVTTHPTTGSEAVKEGVLLSTQGGLVVKIGDRIETNPPGRLVFTNLPPGLRREPTLLATLDAQDAAKRVLDLRYLTGALTWQANYTADYAEADGMLSLQGWATVTNRTGIDFENATLRFVAGSINRRSAPPRPERMRSMAKMAMDSPAPSGGIAAQAVGDYYLYQLPRKATLANQQTKQLALLKATKVPVVREYRLSGRGFHYRRHGGVQRKNAEIILRFKNAKSDGLGVPLAAGIVRVYGKHDDGSSIFLGEDRMRHTAKGRKVELSLGRAFDISTKRRQTSFKKQGLAKNTFEAAYKIEVSNAKSKPAAVKIVEYLPGEWRILEETHRHSKNTAQQAVWTLNVPAGGKAVLTYKVRVHR